MFPGYAIMDRDTFFILCSSFFGALVFYIQKYREVVHRLDEMKFICFHGLGANGSIFEVQTGRLREELGNGHEFEFLDGEYETGPPPGIGEVYPGPYCSFHPLPNNTANVNRGLEDIKESIAVNGPYDGAIGYSQGAQMLLGLLLQHQEKNPFEPDLFQVAIFISGAMSLEQKQAIAKGTKVKLPTTHIWGGKTDFSYAESLKLREACVRNLRTEFEHNEGHNVPNRSDMVIGMANAIRKTIDLAIYKN